MATIKEIIGMSFKLHREKKGIAQQELADTLGIDRQYMWKIESGKINMTLDYLENLMQKMEAQRVHQIQTIQ
jgi:transcriptional regulator with XRE-family HTH domain